MRTRRCGITPLLAAAVLLVGCSTGSDDELDLGTGAHAAPDLDRTPDPDPLPDPEEPEPLYPPLPPPEVDPDSHVSEEDQLFFLAIHAEAYEAAQTALATGEFDEVRLGQLHTPEEVDSLRASVDQRREAGTVLRSPDTRVLWVRVTDAEDGAAVVQDCSIIGPLTGSYDLQTGEQVTFPETGPRVVEQYIAPVRIDGDLRHRVAGTRQVASSEPCDG